MRRSGWRISVDARSYMPKVDDPTLSCRLLRPQEMPRYIADGTLDADAPARDWLPRKPEEILALKTCDPAASGPRGNLSDGHADPERFQSRLVPSQRAPADHLGPHHALAQQGCHRIGLLRHSAVLDGDPRRFTILLYHTPDLAPIVGQQITLTEAPPGGAQVIDLMEALRASLKLPTGNSHRLLGSGSTDFALWLDASEDCKLPALGHLTGFGAVGGMVMSEGDVLKRQQRTLAGFASLGLGWSPISWFALKVQANGHTPLYQDSNLREVNKSSIQLVSGGTFAFTKNTSLDLGISEDVIVETSPDVVFTLTLRTLF